MKTTSGTVTRSAGSHGLFLALGTGVIGLGAGYFWGSHVGSLRSASPETLGTQSPPHPSRSTSTRPRDLAQHTASTAEPNSAPTLPTYSTEKLKQELALAALGGTRKQQADRLLALLDQMTVENAEDLVSKLGSIQNRGFSLSSSVWDKAWEKWGEIDGAGALDHFIKYPSGKGTSDIRAVASAAARTNPVALRAWLEANQARAFATPVWMETFATMQIATTPNEPSAAVSAVLAATDDPALLHRCLDLLSDKLVASGGMDYLKGFYHALPESQKDASYSHVLKRLVMADKDAAKALFHAESASRSPDPQSTQAFVRELAKSQPTETLEWAATLPAASQTQKALQESVYWQSLEAWRGTRPDQAIKWLLNHANESFSPRIARSWIRQYGNLPEFQSDEFKALAAQAAQE